MLKRNSSFTLVETLVVIAVFTLIMITITGTVVMLYRTYSYQWQQSIAIDEARRGIETMVKEIREAREGENGSYPIELAGNKEFIFYSDIDNDGKSERVRYFLGQIINQNLTQECYTSLAGGICNVSFSGFLTGTLKSAKVRVSVEGDLGSWNEYVDIFVDGQNLARLCQAGCADCADAWQGTQTFDVLSQAQDGILNFTADASWRVNSAGAEPDCFWQGYFHTMKAKFELEISQEIQGTELKKGVIKSTDFPPSYPLDQENISIITSYVRNAPPIFEYFDPEGNKIEDYPSRLIDTKLMKVFLVVNVDPNRPPQDFELESYVQLRNLKTE